jgi:hypothetical protein
MAVLQRRHGRRLQSAVPFRFCSAGAAIAPQWDESAHEQVIGAHS